MAVQRPLSDKVEIARKEHGARRRGAAGRLHERCEVLRDVRRHAAARAWAQVSAHQRKPPAAPVDGQGQQAAVRAAARVASDDQGAAGGEAPVNEKAHARVGASVPRVPRRGAVAAASRAARGAARGAAAVAAAAAAAAARDGAATPSPVRLVAVEVHPALLVRLVLRNGSDRRHHRNLIKVANPVVHEDVNVRPVAHEVGQQHRKALLAVPLAHAQPPVDVVMYDAQAAEGAPRRRRGICRRTHAHVPAAAVRGRSVPVVCGRAAAVRRS